MRALVSWTAALALMLLLCAPLGADDEAEPAGRPGRPGPAEPPTRDLRKDLEELIRRGGTLPDGFVPHGLRDRGPSAKPGEPTLAGLARAAGKLIQRYLAVKADPLRGPVYEAAVRELAEALVRVGEGQAVDPGPLGMRLLGQIMRGMADPEQAPVYREILQIVSLALAGEAGSPRPPAPLPPRAVLTTFGGATLRVERSLTGLWSAQVVRLAPGSLAARMSLAAGDTVLGLDGRGPDPATLTRADRDLGKPGKLLLRVLRREGRTELLEIEFEAADGPDGEADR